MSILQRVRHIRGLIMEDDLFSAVGELYAIHDIPGDTLNDLIVQSARAHRVEKAFHRGTLTFEDSNANRNRIIAALLQICDEVEKLGKPAVEAAQPGEGHVLHAYPRGPMVEGHLIDLQLIEEYAAIIPPSLALPKINQANKFRMEADPGDERVTIIKSHSLLSPLNVRPLDFWIDAFNEARLNGPRMVAALIITLGENQLSDSAQQRREELLQAIKQ